MRTLVFLSLLTLAGCGASDERFPSLLPRPGEEPRVIEDPGAGQAIGLAEAEKASLDITLAEQEHVLGAVRVNLGRAEKELDSALRAARGSAVASSAWTEAQLALSRFDSARAPLAEIGARLPEVQILVDALPETDANRARVDALARELDALDSQSRRKVEQANDILQD